MVSVSGSIPQINLPPSLTASLASGHPWVYRDHVGGFRAPTGSWVRVQAGSFVAFGLWDAESPIAVRLFSTVGPPDQTWIERRVHEAWQLRAHVRAQGVTGYRLICGEADQLPGIVVDVYGGFAVVVTYSRSLGALLPALSAAVANVAGLRGVVRRQKDERGIKLIPLWGELPPDEIVVEEFGMRLVAELKAGQKTGLFFDHRDNRWYVRRRAAGLRVLNLFSYTGGFSVAAALGNAASVVSVDSARPAMESCLRNFELNGLHDFSHEAIVEDVFAFLQAAQRNGLRFDLIVCDPPSFAQSRDQARAAEKAYRRLVALGLSVTSPGGTFCAASCTSQVGPTAFRKAISDAARKMRVRFQILTDVGHAEDHPVLIGHEEGRYLKFVAGRVLPRC